MTLKCAVVQPGVYNLNRFRVCIIDGTTGDEDENGNLQAKRNAISHFVSEIRLPDDILITVNDLSAK